MSYQPSPPVRQGQTPVSLLSSAERLPPEVRDYSRWRTGLAHRNTDAIGAETRARDCSGTEWSERETLELPEFDPFIIGTFHGCSGFIDDRRSYTTEANDALEDKEAWLIAREVWTGAQGGLSLQSTATDIGGTVGSVRDTIDALVARRQDTVKGGRTFIHLPRIGLGEIEEDVTRSGDRLTLPDGIVIIPGPGYPNTAGDWGPWTDPEDPDSGAAAASGQVWIYATGPIELERGPIEVNDSGDGNAALMNLFEVYVQRPVIARWDTTAVFAGLAAPQRNET